MTKSSSINESINQSITWACLCPECKMYKSEFLCWSFPDKKSLLSGDLKGRVAQSFWIPERKWALTFGCRASPSYTHNALHVGLSHIKFLLGSHRRSEGVWGEIWGSSTDARILREARQTAGLSSKQLPLQLKGHEFILNRWCWWKDYWSFVFMLF